MSDSLDLVGWCLANPGGAEVWFPLLPGSRGLFPSPVRGIKPASNQIAPVNRRRLLYKPLLYLRTRLYDTWFSRSNLDVMFSRGYWGQLFRGIGPVQWRFGNDIPRQWIDCKVERLELSWGDGEDPVEAALWLRPYGYATVPSPVSGLRRPGGRVPWMARDILYSGLDHVWGGSLVIDNQLTPVAEGIPGTAGGVWPSPDGRAYPTDYANDCIAVTAELLQSTGATVIADPFTAEGYLPLTGFDATFRNPVLSAYVTARYSALKPGQDEAVRGSLALGRREYEGNQTASGSPLLTFAGNG